MYHIGDLKKFIRCPRYYFLARDDKAKFNKFLRTDESIIELFAKHLHIEEHFQGVQGDNNDKFFDNKDKYEWFVKTRFEDAGLRIRIPIMQKDEDRFDLYFVHNGTAIKELDYFYYRVNLEVLRKLGVEVDDVYIAYINGNYVFEDELDIDSLFIITDHYKGKRLIDLFDDEICDYKEIIRRIEATSLDSYNPKKIRFCHNRNICPYYYDCFKEELDMPDDSILTLVSSQYKDQMCKSGIKYLKDADLNLVEGNRVQYAQIMASKNGGMFIDKYSLEFFLDSIKERPISFVDFEWDTYLVPQYNKMKALDVIPFEYALYVLEEDGTLNNYSFVGNGDCRKEFLEDLLEKLPKEGPILAYNANGAECRRLNELAEIFPDYKEEIDKVVNRFVDLASPFLEGVVYDIRMEGNFTLKRLVNIVSDYDYKKLDISDGMDAVYNWRNIDKGVDNIDEEGIVNKLIEYCSLDAYGLYLVYNWLNKLI